MDTAGRIFGVLVFSGFFWPTLSFADEGVYAPPPVGLKYSIELESYRDGESYNKIKEKRECEIVSSGQGYWESLCEGGTLGENGTVLVKKQRYFESYKGLFVVRDQELLPEFDTSKKTSIALDSQYIDKLFPLVVGKESNFASSASQATKIGQWPEREIDGVLDYSYTIKEGPIDMDFLGRSYMAWKLLTYSTWQNIVTERNQYYIPSIGIMVKGNSFYRSNDSDNKILSHKSFVVTSITFPGDQ